MMMGRWTRLVLAGAAVVCGWASEARALEIQPISLSLSEKAPTGMLAISNQSTEPVRFHIKAMAWSQKPDGEAVLAPTDDVVFFPAMLTLNPQEGRNLRVGVKIKPGGAEKTYRIMVQELPRMLATAQGAGAVGMLTKMAIPVFFQPSAVTKATMSVTSPNLDRTSVKFTVKNHGNVHTKTDTVYVKAKQGEAVLHTEELPGWYVLAGGVREYDFNLPVGACAAVDTLEVEFKSGAGPVRAVSRGIKCTP